MPTNRPRSKAARGGYRSLHGRQGSRRPPGTTGAGDLVDLDAVLGVGSSQSVAARCADLRPGARMPGVGDDLLLVADGALLRATRVGVREGAELLGSGDVLCPEASGPSVFSTGLRALTPCRIALLDGPARAAVAGEPELSRAVFDAIDRRTAAVATQVLLVQLTSIEERLRFLVPALADRWGVVTADGVLLPAFLSHTVLAALVGVRRPSLTAALGATALLQRLPDRRWRVAPELTSLL